MLSHQLSSLQLLVAYVSLLLLAQVEDKPLAEETTARRGPGKCVGLVDVFHARLGA